MSYDMYERHAVVGQILRQAVNDSNHSETRILDVGGWIGLLERFLPYRVISINPDGSGHLFGDGCALPIADNSVEAVVSIDTLEHLPRENRLLFLRECLRVARYYVVVAAPYGSDDHREYEKQLNDLFLNAYGRPHIYLNEHVQYGLPGAKDLDFFELELATKNTRRFYAGDYFWEGRCFERMLLAQNKPKWVQRFLNMYNYIISLAIFHTVRIYELPDDKTNRFYLLFEKQNR